MGMTQDQWDERTFELSRPDRKSMAKDDLGIWAGVEEFVVLFPDKMTESAEDDTAYILRPKRAYQVICLSAYNGRRQDVVVAAAVPGKFETRPKEQIANSSAIVVGASSRIENFPIHYDVSANSNILLTIGDERPGAVKIVLRCWYKSNRFRRFWAEICSNPAAYAAVVASVFTAVTAITQIAVVSCG